MSEDLDFQIQIGQGATDDASLQSQKEKLKKKPQQDPEPKVQDSPAIGDNEKLFDLKKSAHPVALVFHLIFKIVGLICFLFLNLVLSLWLSDDQLSDWETLLCILVVLLAAFDFWTVKNITGRLLVGLRWWSEITEDGTEKWHFESYDEKFKTNIFDRTVFWWAQIIMCLFWFAIIIVDLVKLEFQWATIALVCLILTAINYLGFFRCSKDHKKKLKGVIHQAAWAGLRKNFEG